MEITTMTHSKKEMKNGKNGNIQNGGNGQQNKNPKETEATVPNPKVRKPKTPAGHIRYTDGKAYLLQSVEVRANLHCKACRKDNARLMGYIVVGSKIYYVAKCPWHPQDVQFLEESIFQEKYPDILPEKHQEKPSNPYNPNWPVQRSYCKDCRATTAEIIGEIETEYGPKWVVRCTECGMTWHESKERFAMKYIGTDEFPPMYRQTTPKPASHFEDPVTDSSMEELKGIKVLPKNDKKPEASSATAKNEQYQVMQDAPANATVTSSEKKEEMILQVHGITLKLPSGTNASVEIIDGQPIISIQ